MKYRIIRKAYVDEKGIEGTPYYVIQYEKKIIWGLISYWKYETHTEGSASGSYQSNTIFKTLETAEDFAANILCKHNIRDTISRKIVSNGICNTSQ